jgi:hypothetical protein
VRQVPHTIDLNQKPGLTVIVNQWFCFAVKGLEAALNGIGRVIISRVKILAPALVMWTGLEGVECLVKGMVACLTNQPARQAFDDFVICYLEIDDAIQPPVHFSQDDA